MSAGIATESPLRLLQSTVAALASGGIEALPDVAARIAEVHGAERAAVLALPDPRSSTIYLLAASDEPGALRLPFELARYAGIASAVSSHRPLVAPGPEPLPFAVELEGADEPESPPGLLATLPLSVGRTVVGCLTLRLAPGRAFGAEEVASLAEVAQVLALVLRGERALESLADQTRRFSTAALQGGRRRAAIDGYRDFFESAADGILVVADDGEVLHINRAAELLTGYARSGLCGRSLFDVVPAPQREGLAALVRRSASGDNLAGFDFELFTTSGETLRVSASTSAVLAEHRAAVFAFRDVTEARALESELRTTRDFLVRLIDSVVDGIVAADMRGEVILFNRGAQRVLGYAPEEVVGRLTVTQLYPHGVAREMMAELRVAGAGGIIPGARREVVTRSGERIPVQLSASIIYEDGREVATIGVFSDLRERLVIEQRLAEAQEQLVLSQRGAVLAELAGAAAHELNQPLTSVMGYSEMLLKRMPVDDPSRRAVAIVHREAERMAEIVRKIGRITRYETRHYVGATAILDIEKSADHG